MLHDGKVPTEADDPSGDFFFAADTGGERIQVDLGRACEFKQVASHCQKPRTFSRSELRAVCRDCRGAGRALLFFKT